MRFPTDRNAPLVAVRKRNSPPRKQSFVEISIMQQAMEKQPVGRRSCPDTGSSKLNRNFMPQNYARCMTDRRKVQLLGVTLVGMIAFGVYKIGWALSTGILETRLVRASWLDNPAGFVFYLAVFVVGTAAFSAWLFVIIHDERSGSQHVKSQLPTFDRPEYRSSAPDKSSRDERP
jgi:hypothetical protein